MIITDRLVILNNPKTGSTFVRAVMRRLYGGVEQSPGRRASLLNRLGISRQSGLTELMLPNLKALGPRPPDQHGAYEQIPSEHRGKVVVSVVRDPFQRLLSIYRYRWWAKHPLVDPAILAHHFPNFPELSFEEFVRMEDLAAGLHLPASGASLQVGRQTIRFIQMFFRHPAEVFRRLDAEYLDSDHFLRDLPPIRFLRTERLNHDLYYFLREHGYAEERIAFVLGHEPLNTTPPQAGSPWSEALVAHVLDRERLLFRILRHLGFEYATPSWSQRGSRA
jgi:hypothetical protein